jgi:hypothetical protein
LAGREPTLKVRLEGANGVLVYVVGTDLILGADADVTADYLFRELWLI